MEETGTASYRRVAAAIQLDIRLFAANLPSTSFYRLASGNASICSQTGEKQL